MTYYILLKIILPPPRGEQGATGERHLANGRGTFVLKLYNIFLHEMIYPTSNLTWKKSRRETENIIVKWKKDKQWSTWHLIQYIYFLLSKLIIYKGMNWILLFNTKIGTRIQQLLIDLDVMCMNNVFCHILHFLKVQNSNIAHFCCNFNDV